MVIFFNGKNPTLSFSEIRAVRSLRIAGEYSAREESFIFIFTNSKKQNPPFGGRQLRSPRREYIFAKQKMAKFIYIA